MDSLLKDIIQVTFALIYRGLIIACAIKYLSA
jgi:hypothetical protein